MNPAEHYRVAEELLATASGEPIKDGHLRWPTGSWMPVDVVVAMAGVHAQLAIAAQLTPQQAPVFIPPTVRTDAADVDDLMKRASLDRAGRQR